MTPLSSTPSSRKILKGEAAEVVENVDVDFGGENVVLCVVDDVRDVDSVVLGSILSNFLTITNGIISKGTNGKMLMHVFFLSPPSH